jgi:hypothetical protein
MSVSSSTDRRRIVSLNIMTIYWYAYVDDTGIKALVKQYSIAIFIAAWSI